MEYLKKNYNSNDLNNSNDLKLTNEIKLLKEIEITLNNPIENKNDVIKKLNKERNNLLINIKSILKTYDEALNKKNTKHELLESKNDFTLLKSIDFNNDSKKEFDKEKDKINNNNNKISIVNIIAHMLYNKIN